MLHLCFLLLNILFQHFISHFYFPFFRLRTPTVIFISISVFQNKFLLLHPNGLMLLLNPSFSDHKLNMSSAPALLKCVTFSLCMYLLP